MENKLINKYLTESNNLDIIKNILKTKTAAKIKIDKKEKLMDMTTANMIMTVHKGLDSKLQKKWEGMIENHLSAVIKIGWQMVK